MNQDVAAQMVVPDEGFAAPLVVTNKGSLAGRKEKNTLILPSLLSLVLFKDVECGGDVLALQGWLPLGKLHKCHNVPTKSVP